jgi:hypothetical protein
MNSLEPQYSYCSVGEQAFVCCFWLNYPGFVSRPRHRLSWLRLSYKSPHAAYIYDWWRLPVRFSVSSNIHVLFFVVISSLCPDESRHTNFKQATIFSKFLPTWTVYLCFLSGLFNDAVSRWFIWRQKWVYAASLLKFPVHTQLHTNTHTHTQTVRIPWTSYQPVAEAANYTTHSKHKNENERKNLWSQQSNGRRLRLGWHCHLNQHRRWSRAVTWKWFGRKWSWPNLRYSPGICE